MFASGSPLEIKTLECLLKTFNIRTVPIPEANLGPANLSVSFALFHETFFVVRVSLRFL